MNEIVRLEWEEGRDGELFLMIGERATGSWSFFERSSWELRWYQAPVTPANIERAEALLMSGDAARIAA
jgi:hypothetical protein